MRESVRRSHRDRTHTPPLDVALVAGTLLSGAWPLPAHGAARDPAAPEIAEGAVEHMVAMRDGVRLATNVLLPEGEGPWPAIVTGTPCGKDGRFDAQSARYIDGGDAPYVVQGTRGGLHSEGEHFSEMRGIFFDLRSRRFRADRSRSGSRRSVRRASTIEAVGSRTPTASVTAGPTSRRRPASEEDPGQGRSV